MRQYIQFLLLFAVFAPLCLMSEYVLAAPSYIGPYRYQAGSNPAYFSTEDQAARAFEPYDLERESDKTICSFQIRPTSGANWEVGNSVEGVDSGSSKRYDFRAWYQRGGNCIADSWVSGFVLAFRSRTVCSSTQRFLDGTCIEVMPISASYKGSNFGPACPAKGGHSCGDPINTSTGNMWYVEIDFKDRNGGDLTLRRTYNSFINYLAQSGEFGGHWTTPYNASIRAVINPALPGSQKCYTRSDNHAIFCDVNWVPANTDVTNADTVEVSRGDGKSYRFTRKSGSYVGAADTDDRLTAVYGVDNDIVGFRYQDESTREIEQYDTKGELLSITSRTGSIRRLTYSAGTTNDTAVSRYPFNAPVCAHVQAGSALPSGRLLCVTDDWGRQLNFEYDAKGRITLMTDPAGRFYAYEYDGADGGCTSVAQASPACSANNLTKVIYPDGASRRYLYNESAYINGGGDCSSYGKALGNGHGHLLNSMTGLIDENNVRYASWDYECAARATRSQLAGNVNRVTLMYRTTNDLQVAYSTLTSTVGDPSAPVVTSVRTFTPTRVLDVVKNGAVDWACAVCGPIQSRTFDANGNVASTTDWNGSVTKYTYDLSRNLETSRTEGYASSVARTITTMWHQTLRVPVTIAQPKLITKFVYDAAGNVLSRTEQATSDTTGASGVSAAAVGVPRIWTYTYNTHGQLITAIGPRTDIVDKTTFDYDAIGNLASVTDALGRAALYSNYDENGNVGHIVAANGLTTDLTYTLRGKLASFAVSGGTIQETTSYEYDPAGQLTKQTNPDGSWTVFGYDPAHRLISVTDNLGNTIAYTLDLTGNRIREQVKDPTGALTRQVARTFDTLGQMTRVTGATQ